MAHQCYISFKTEDLAFKLAIQELGIDFIDRSLDTPIDSDDEDEILRQIRENYLATSTVTLHLIGTRSAEILGWDEQRFIKRELQASLYDGAGNTKNGILGIVLPTMETVVYKGSQTCVACGQSHNIVAVNDATTVREFSYNYYIPNGKCAHAEPERYCVLARWSEFAADPAAHIDAAFDKRTAPIAEKTKVRP